MRVAFDARHAGRGLGIATFVTHLAAALIELGHDDIVWLGDPALAPKGVSAWVRADRIPYPALDGVLGRAIARHQHVDLMHFTGNTGWSRDGPIPSILTLHDLIFLSTAQTHRSAVQAAGHCYERLLIRRWLASATLVAVPSETVARAVAGRFPGAPPARVIHEGVARGERAPESGAQSPYLVAFAGRDPRKRTAEVVAAWRALAPLALKLKLLAGGGLPPGLREELAPDLERGAVEIFAHIPRATLWQLLGGALALVYPTADEGFGLPVLEGMAAGTPVLAGLAAVTREVGGDAIVPLDEADVVGSIAHAVRRLHAEPGRTRGIVERGRARAADFSWQRTAERYSQLYREAVELGAA